MPRLTLREVPAPTQASEEVVVQEFGTDEESGEPFAVLVRGLTAYEWDLLMARAWRIDPSDNGADPTLSLKDDYNEACLVAAWCSYDDDGRLVFGVDPDDAEARVRALPVQYRPAIRRIHKRVLELSGVARGERPALEEAEKN